MDLEAFRIFAIVAREGSIQGASNAGAGSRTTIRRRLDALEETVGVPLLYRNSGGVELTEAGESLARRVDELLTNAEVLIQTTREIALAPPRGIRVSVPPGPPPPVVTRVLDFMRELWTDARLDLLVRDDDARLDPREVDLCVTLVRDVPPGPYDIYRLGEVRAMLIASPGYLAEHGPITTVAQVFDHPIACWCRSSDSEPARIPTSDGEIRVTPMFTTNDMHMIHELVRADAGLGFVPHAELESGSEEYVPVLRDIVGEDYPLQMLVSRAVADSPRIKMLSDILESTFGAAGS